VLSSLMLGWLAFLLATLLINRLLGRQDLGWPQGLAVALASLFLAIKSLPVAQESGPIPAVAPPLWDLPLRMAATAALVWGLTHFAQLLGPRLGGLLAPFPIASTVLTVFAHSQGGSDAARSVLKGLLLALNAFAIFCAVLAVSLSHWSLAASFGAALGVATLVQAAMVRWQWKARAEPQAR